MLSGSAHTKADHRTTNILRLAFTRADPKSAIKTDNLTIFFALLGSARVKDERKMLAKLTPIVKTCLYFNLRLDYKYFRPNVLGVQSTANLRV